MNENTMTATTTNETMTAEQIKARRLRRARANAKADADADARIEAKAKAKAESQRLVELPGSDKVQVDLGTVGTHLGRMTKLASENPILTIIVIGLFCQFGWPVVRQMAFDKTPAAHAAADIAPTQPHTASTSTRAKSPPVTFEFVVAKVSHGKSGSWMFVNSTTDFKASSNQGVGIDTSRITISEVGLVGKKIRATGGLSSDGKTIFLNSKDDFKVIE